MIENNKKYNGIATLNSLFRTQVNEFLKAKLKEVGNHELVPSHGSLLWIVYNNNGKVQIKTIYEILCKQKPTVTEMIKRLVVLGYLKKVTCKDDKRITYVVATEKAMNFRQDFENISKQLTDKIYKGFSEDEKDQYVSLVDRAIKNFD